jgi:hypothetical protein
MASNTEVTADSTFSQTLDYLNAEIDSPKRVVVDGVDVTNRSLLEQIQMARFRRSSALMSRGLGACVIQQGKPPTALGVHVTSTS